MGKVTGFLEYDRQEQKYQLAGERVRHFREFTLPLDTNDLRKQAGRCMDCGIPFWHGPTGCPVHNQIPDWNDLVWSDDWEERSEERRVGQECRSRWTAYHLKEEERTA